jgi:tRNA dimethylallyltransferase
MEPQTNKKKLIVIAGPTAVGKTAISIELARHLNTEIISCDSRQVYKELNIGVARPSEEELQAVKHHLIAHRSIQDSYNAGLFADEANAIMDSLFQFNDYVVMTGGTGLYIKAATEGLDPLPTADSKLREELQRVLDTKGISHLQSIAEKLRIDRKDTDYNNSQRLIRAIEISKSDNKPTKRPSIKNFNTLYFYVNRDRTELYNRINKRVDLMITAGFENEARSVYAYKDLNALKTVGYNELFNYFDGNVSLEDAIDKIKQKTRNYAKRQLTWFRNQGDYKEIKPVLEDILKHIS